MFPEQFISLEFYQKKKDILLYRAKDHARNYILKSIIAKDDAVRQAFYDEYETLSNLIHPSLPIYYGITEDFHYPDSEETYLTLCMEDCFSSLPLNEFSFDSNTLLKIIYRTGEILLYLINHGILYTDLNPSNILIHQDEESLDITLIDFTYSYYFLRNPNPDYPIRFSYNLSPSLKGHQMLIQELALLLQEMISQDESLSYPSSVYLLLETGLHPADTMLLPDFLLLLKQTFI